jgi:hypothetical protein
MYLLFYLDDINFKLYGIFKSGEKIVETLKNVYDTDDHLQPNYKNIYISDLEINEVNENFDEGIYFQKFFDSIEQAYKYGLKRKDIQ